MAALPLPTFLPCLELGLQVNNHDLIPYFSCELAAMSHVSLPKKGEPGAIMRQNMLWTQGRQTGYHQEHQVPGAPPMPLTISMYLFLGVEMPRK